LLSRNGKNNEDGSFDWRDAVIDAAITAGITACTSGVAMIATGTLFTTAGLCTFAFTVLGQFFGFLAVKRKLVEKK